MPLWFSWCKEVSVLFSSRSERPLDWVPEEVSPHKQESLGEDFFDCPEVIHIDDRNIADIFSIHADSDIGNFTTSQDVAMTEN